MSRIKELRIKSGLMQEELAEIIGVSQSAVSGWETGAYLPTTSKLRILADTLGCSVEDILEGVVYDRYRTGR